MPNQRVAEHSSGAAFEIWWSGGESAQVGNLCKAAGHEDVGAIGLSSHVFGVEGTQHVFGRGSGIINPQAGPVTNHVIEFWWTGPEAPHLEDLNDRAKSPFLADSATSCHTLELGPGGPSTQSVFYRSGRDIIRLTFRDGQWTSRNLSTSSAGEFTFASGSPASHAVAADGTHHVFYIGAEDRHIYEFSWTDNTDPVRAGSQCPRPRQRTDTTGRQQRLYRPYQPRFRATGHSARLLRGRRWQHHRAVVVARPRSHP